ncbi:Hsp33 family molecular chaperone HslO [Acidithiobacillus sp.]|uniref:Hsp33 family molecular chaperone HslO n=1 Tax=Acidithiobacillus sp. TaxID=1872118 RepID=UPI0025C125B2|nr:Hsp33 family molecular chaperone HslO [Acidithiobacillus sp.]
MKSEQPNFVQGFYWETLPLRGARCRVDGILAELRQRFSPTDTLLKLMAEAVVGLVLMSSTQKQYERLTLQAQSSGDLRLLVADMFQGGGLRAYAHWLGGDGDVDLRELPDALLAVTVDPGLDRDRYQGLVRLRHSLTASLEAYFGESVQAPAYFRIVVDIEEGVAGGYFLQRLPGILSVEEWRVATQFFAVGSDRSLMLARPEQFLPEIFPGVGLRLQKQQALHFQCSCSRERVENMLLALGEAEVMTTLQQEGAILVTCEYCQQSYRLGEAEVAALFGQEAARH